jgi:hypothetical protein
MTASAVVISMPSIFDEDEAQHQVLVFGRIHVGAQFVGRGPEGLLDVVAHG